MSFKSIEEFVESFKDFNTMYKKGNPKFLIVKELAEMDNFQKIIEEEISEGNELCLSKNQLDYMTEVSDWLGDVVVYCFTKAYSLGIPLIDIISIIMDSNKSKLGIDGKPIYDKQTNKILKGPNYWKPEPKIKEFLQKYLVE